MRAKTRAASAVLLFLPFLAPNPAKAQASQSQLYELYLSTSTPSHYRQAIAKLLKLPPPSTLGGDAAQGLSPRSTPSNTVETIQVGCNPLRPSCRPLLFANVPAGARLRIYSFTGALIKDLTADGSGAASWDGANQNGQPAASGVYFVLVQGAGQRKTVRIAVQR